MERPEGSRWRDVYQETIRDYLEMYDASPRYRVHPDGIGGESVPVSELSFEERHRCAIREAEITMNRVVNTRKY